MNTFSLNSLRSKLENLIGFGLMVTLSCVGVASSTVNPKGHPSTATLEALQKISEVSVDDVDAALQFALEREAMVEPGSLDDAYLKLSRIQLLLERNQLEASIEPLSQTIEYGVLDPATQERTVRGLGHVLYQLERREEMLALFEKQFSDPKALDPETLQLHAVTLLETGQADEAILRCELALSKKAKLNLTLCQIAAAALQSQERHSDSAHYIELILESNPNDESLWDQLAAAYYRAGALWKVLGAIDRAQERRFKKDLASQVSTIEILYELEQYAATANKIEKWVDREPGTLEKRIWLLLLYCYEQQNLDTQAIATLERASKLTPWPEMDLQLADRHWQQGDHASVYDDIMRAMAKGPVPKAANAWTLATAAAISLGNLENAETALAKAQDAGVEKRKVERLEVSIEKLRKMKTQDTLIVQ